MGRMVYVGEPAVLEPCAESARSACLAASHSASVPTRHDKRTMLGAIPKQALGHGRFCSLSPCRRPLAGHNLPAW